jgi:hypothetical protein
VVLAVAYSNDQIKEMVWVDHVQLVVLRRNALTFWWGSLKERDYLENLGVDGRIKLTFRNLASYI